VLRRLRYSAQSSWGRRSWAPYWVLPWYRLRLGGRYLGCTGSALGSDSVANWDFSGRNGGSRSSNLSTSVIVKHRYLCWFHSLTSQHSTWCLAALNRASLNGLVVRPGEGSPLRDAYEQVRRDILECKVKVRNVEVDTANVLDEEIVRCINKTVVRLFAAPLQVYPTKSSAPNESNNVISLTSVQVVSIF
jgi:hypothetical protein